MNGLKCCHFRLKRMMFVTLLGPEHLARYSITSSSLPLVSLCNEIRAPQGSSSSPMANQLNLTQLNSAQLNSIVQRDQGPAIARVLPLLLPRGHYLSDIMNSQLVPFQLIHEI